MSLDVITETLFMLINDFATITLQHVLNILGTTPYISNNAGSKATISLLTINSSM